MEFLRRYPEVHFELHARGKPQRAVWVTAGGGRAEATAEDLGGLLDKLEAAFAAARRQELLKAYPGRRSGVSDPIVGDEP
jgi:hypothetical protein